MDFSEIEKHYRHAKRKHPHFADALVVPSTRQFASEKLAEVRECLTREVIAKNVFAEDVLFCELWEMMEAIASGSKENALYELHDVIAVLLRMRDEIVKNGV